MIRTSRRDFLKKSILASSGLVIGLSSSRCGKINDIDESITNELSPLVIIENSGKITLINLVPDLGQGSTQAIPALIAEELEVSLDNVVIAQSNGDQKFGNQIAGGSGGVVRSWETARKAGAAAREMLIKAAAEKWKIDESSCKTQDGSIINTISNEVFTYGQLADAASKFPVPQEPKLKPKTEFKIIGKSKERPDVLSRVTGKAIYGIDVDVPGMVWAAVAHSPSIYNPVESINDTKTRAIPGVIDVVRCERDLLFRKTDAVAVIANNTWAAIQGRNSLEIKWGETKFHANSKDYVDRMYEAAKVDGPTHLQSGQFDNEYKNAKRKIERVYETQFVAHAMIEPEAVVADVKQDSAEIWIAYQAPEWARESVAKFLNIPYEKVTVHIQLMGGSFGRKSFEDYLLEACMLSKSLNKPVKLLWTREDDLTQGPFRPAMLSRLQGIIGDKEVIGFHHHAIGETFDGQIHRTLKDGEPDKEVCNEISLENSQYNFQHTKISHTRVKTEVPILWWRSVWGSNFGWSQECFIDDMAHELKMDPLELRLKSLSSDRHKNVLNVLTEKSGYHDKLPPGKARGMAIWKSFGSVSACCVEVEKVGNKIKINRAVSVLDCGLFVNEDMVKAQMEGSIIMGLSIATKEEITFTKGAGEQSNFHQYQLLRMDEVPEIETHIVANDEKPTGVGEPTLPPVSAALGNAIFKLTGKRFYKLPVSLSLA